MRLAVLLVAALTGQAAAQRLNLPGHNNPPPARPQRIAGGEGFPPLPLPATPVRRSEKKREPAPPILVAKLEYAKRVYNVTNDAQNLLNFASRVINVTYRPEQFGWRSFRFDPTEVPVLYLSGHEPLPALSSDQLDRLRQYVLAGGTIVANACCGAPEFADGFRRFAAALFPDRPLLKLSAEHPLFLAYEKVTDVRYHRGSGENFVAPPLLEGIDLGCRTAVIFASADLANGWYGQEPPANFPPGFWIVGDDARRIGLNLVTYVLANLQYARAFALAQVQYRPTTNPGQALTIGQLIHTGDWDPNPSALDRLQKYILENSTIPVAFRRLTLDPGDPAIFDCPVIYLVGHRDFAFSDAQIADLRRYLNQGGVLLAEACCGRREFDLAFRREIVRVLPDAKLTPLPADHGLFDVSFRITEVEPTDLAHAYYGDFKTPRLEAISLDGRTAVLYSPLALANGWEGLPHGFSAGYRDSDAARLGVNIFVYIMSH